MSIRAGIRRFFRLALRRSDLAARDVDREIGFHLDQRAKQLEAAGMSPDEARAEAQLRFGDVDSARAELSASAIRREAQLTWRDRFDALLDDLRYVTRSLARSRAFSAVIILTFALGIGANAAMFGIIDRLLLSGPEHVVDSKRVQKLYVSIVDPAEGPATYSSFGYVTYALLRDQAKSLDKVAAYSSPYQTTIGGGDRAELAEVGHATWDLFPMLGVRPALGRFFSEAEDRPPNGEHVMILAHDLWQRAFNGDSAVLGTTTQVQGVPHHVIGVAPPGFTGVELDQVDAWVPMSLTHPVRDWPTSWRAQWLRVVARLAPAATAEAASAEATEIFRRNYTGRWETLKTGTLSFRPTTFSNSGKEPPETAVARWLIGVSIIVLLVACANVANLLLVRGLGRRREIAVRLALGVSAARLWRLLVLESLLLSLAGCAAGLLLAYWGGTVIRKLLLPNVAWVASPVDARVFAISCAVALACGIVVGLLPTFQAGRIGLSAALKAGSQQAGVPRSRMRSTLLFAQCALSVVLLVGAGLFVRSLNRARSLDLGFRPERVLRAQISWPPVEQPAERERRAAFYGVILERLRVTADVRHAAIAVGTPFGFSFGVDLRVPGHDSLPKLPGGGPYISVVTNDYFEAMGTKLLKGRTFEPGDRAESERVAILNAPMARALWPGQEALGKCMYIFNDSLPCARIVGVVGEMRRNALVEQPGMQYYVPFGQERGVGGSALMIEPAASVQDYVPRLQRLIRELDPTVLYVRAEPLQDVIDPLHRQWRLGAALFAVFGALALGIAAIGLYSVIAYLVAQRTPEFGVRLALGATSRRIVSLVLRSGLTVAIAGLVAGIAIALLAGRFVEPLLFDTSPRDPLVLSTVVLALVVVAIAACLLPATRASRVDPITALRSD